MSQYESGRQAKYFYPNALTVSSMAKIASSMKSRKIAEELRITSPPKDLVLYKVFNPKGGKFIPLEGLVILNPRANVSNSFTKSELTDYTFYVLIVPPGKLACIYYDCNFITIRLLA